MTAPYKESDKYDIPRCNGHNYHVFPLGHTRCVMCGWDRYERKKEMPKPPKLIRVLTQAELNTLIEKHITNTPEIFTMFDAYKQRKPINCELVYRLIKNKDEISVEINEVDK